METEKDAGKVTDWDGGDLSASLIEKEEQAKREAQAEKEALAEAEAEKEAEQLEENRELDSEYVRENDADGDSNGYGTSGQEGGKETEKGTAEVPEEEPEISEESTEEDGEGDEVVTEETPESEPEIESAGEDAGTFEMTAYVAFCDTGCTGVTATGYDVSSTIHSPEGLRIIAADPGVLPLGSTVEISSGGNTIQAVVMDTGGDINGNRLDLLVGSEAEAREYGRQSVEVRILVQ